MRKEIFFGVLLAMMASGAFAQSGTDSPYSQFGIGALADQSQSFSRGMNGVGIAMRQGNQVNTVNPASYSAVDSLTMLFDAGLAGQFTNYKEGSTKVNASNANFEYVVGSFRLVKNVGVSFGLLPYSNIGYEYSTTSKLGTGSGTVTESYTGSGGLHQAFVGVGIRPVKPLSVGVNVAYLWGDYTKSVSTSSTSLNSLAKVYTASVSSYNLDLGLQWEQPLTKADVLTLGVTAGLGHKLNADPTCHIINTNSETSTRDTTSFVVRDGLELPLTYGVGLSLRHKESLTVGADVTFQKWGDVKIADNVVGGGYALQGGLLKDRVKVNAGGEWVPNAVSRRFFDRIHYRAGVGYATPYYKINGQDGPKEMSASIGFGIPIINSYNSRSLLSISAQWVHTSAKDLITENSLRINVGLTFNERWFAKWKVE